MTASPPARWAAPSPRAALVVAVGSNASRDVLRSKFTNAGIDADDLDRRMTAVRVVGVGVAHSAHVARRGYLPAAPYRHPDAVLATTAAWLDPDHLTALDATEPNYDRMLASATTHPLQFIASDTHLHSPSVPQDFWIYVSRHGVLGDSPESLAPFASQSSILRWLDERVDLDVAPADPAAACAALAQPMRARRLHAHMRAARLVQDARFAEVTAVAQ